MEATSNQLLFWKKKLAQYLERNYVPEPLSSADFLPPREAGAGQTCKAMREESADPEAADAFFQAEIAFPEPEETFGERLLSLIDRKGLDDVTVYKKAGLDRKLFSKIRNREYHPSKETVFSLLFALGCQIAEAKELLEFAGYAFSRSSKFDLVVKFCLEQRILDLQTVNELLFDNTGRTLSGEIK